MVFDFRYSNARRESLGVECSRRVRDFLGFLRAGSGVWIESEGRAGVEESDASNLGTGGAGGEGARTGWERPVAESEGGKHARGT